MNIKVGDKVKIPAGTLCGTERYYDIYCAERTIEGVVKELTPNQALVHYTTRAFFSVVVVRGAWVLLKDLIKVEEPSMADESTPEGKKIWDDVRKAAERTPDWAKDAAERAVQEYQETLQFKPGQLVKVLRGADAGEIVTVIERSGNILDVRRSDGTVFSAGPDYFEALPCEDKPTGFISIGFVWRVKAVRVHESDDTKAEITITGGESESVDGAVYLTVTREEAKAIHLDDVYVVTIRKQG